MCPQDNQLLQHVVGNGGNAEGYLYGGFTASVGIRATLQALGTKVSSFRNILDFGCGSGRIVRWFADVGPNTSVFATDINARAIEWCRQNICGVRFSQNSGMPPLSFSDAQFDLIFAVSVFTHLDELTQLKWLAELNRIAKPGALILVTIHGENAARQDLPGRGLDEFLQSGQFYRRADEQPTIDGLPDFYQVAFHRQSYVEAAWGNHFKILGYVRHGPWYRQELVILQKPGAAGFATIDLTLPIASLQFPSPGMKINADQIEMLGWAFKTNGSQVQVCLRIDESVLETVAADECRNDVFRFFGSNESAVNSGYLKSVSLQRLEGRHHMAWVSELGNAFPLCATFFKRDRSPIRKAKQLVRRFISNGP